MRKLVWHHAYQSGQRPWVYVAIYPSSRLKGFVLLGATDVVRAAAVRLFLAAEPPDRFPSYVFTVWSITVPQYLYTVHTRRHRASSVNGRSWPEKETTLTIVFRNSSTESKRLTEKLRRRLHSLWGKFSQKLNFFVTCRTEYLRVILCLIKLYIIA